MSRRKKDPLRALSETEREVLEEISRSRSEPASHVERSKVLLAVASGKDYTQAALLAGRRSPKAVSQLVSRFNQEGLTAIVPRHGGGAQRKYRHDEQSRILKEFRRVPDRKSDGTATWSLSTLQRALHKAEDGLLGVSIDTIWKTLRETGYSWQKDRSWCQTGKVKRKRKGGVVEVSDPDALAKKI